MIKLVIYDTAFENWPMVITCKSKLCIDPPGEWRAPFEPNFECCDNWPLAERSLALTRFGIRLSTSSSPSELSKLGGCSLSCGGSGNLFGNIGVSSVFSIDWNCDECCLLASVTLAASEEHNQLYSKFEPEGSLIAYRLPRHHRCRLPFSSATPIAFAAPAREYRPW